MYVIYVQHNHSYPSLPEPLPTFPSHLCGCLLSISITHWVQLVLLIYAWVWGHHGLKVNVCGSVPIKLYLRVLRFEICLIYVLRDVSHVLILKNHWQCLHHVRTGCGTEPVTSWFLFYYITIRVIIFYLDSMSSHPSWWVSLPSKNVASWSPELHLPCTPLQP